MSYALYVGASHTADGHAWLAGYGDEPSGHWLELVPEGAHPPGATITVGMTPEADLPGRLSAIPQAPRTARHLRVAYSWYKGAPAPLTNGGLNEHGVAVRDVWSPSRPELVAMTPPDQTGPTYSDLAKLVLARARTAREGVDLIAATIATHGYSCYGGNSHLIADPSEAYVVVEFAGGKGLWVAERLGPDAIRASRPGHVGAIPREPTPDFLFPPHFVQTAIDLGWFDPAGDAPFDVNRVYGDGKGRWAGAAWIEAEMRARAGRPEKIGFSDVVFAVATPKLTGDSAGYGQIVPLVHPRDPALRVLWHAPVGAVTAPLTPVFLGAEAIPPEYGPHRYLMRGEAGRFLDAPSPVVDEDAVSRVPQAAETARGAVAIHRRLMHLAFQAPDPLLQELWTHWRGLEARLDAELPDVARSAEILLEAGERRLATRLLTDHVETRMRRALDDAEALAEACAARLPFLAPPHAGSLPRGPERIW